jgi:5-enolpyruvylshikimate-3-phosphate synthase
MSAIIAGVNSENGVVLTDALAVNKSYPNFYKDTRFLGGIINEEN